MTSFGIFEIEVSDVSKLVFWRTLLHAMVPFAFQTNVEKPCVLCKVSILPRTSTVIEEFTDDKGSVR